MVITGLLINHSLLINQSLCTGMFPDKLKIAKVIPLFKKDDNKSFGNYRPISLLSSISKIFERVAFNQIYDYLTSNGLLYESQWNSMELLLSAKLAHPKFHGIPWNCSGQRKWRTPSSMKFHGIPWNCSHQWNWRTPSFMEFHGIPWNCSFQRNDALLVPWNSTELLVSSKLAHHKFIGIPWNFVQIQSSMELFPYSRVPWNSMEPLIFPTKFHFFNLINFI